MVQRHKYLALSALIIFAALLYHTAITCCVAIVGLIYAGYAYCKLGVGMSENDLKATGTHEVTSAAAYSLAAMAFPNFVNWVAGVTNTAELPTMVYYVFQDTICPGIAIAIIVFYAYLTYKNCMKYGGRW